MINVVKRTLAGAILQAQATVPGLVAHGTALGLAYVKHDAMSQKIADAILARNGLDTAKVELRAARTTLKGQVKGARLFARTARDVIRPYLIDASSEELAAAGFVGSMAIPTQPDDLLQMLQRLKEYFTANDAHKVEALNVDAARANTLATDLGNAYAAVNTKKGLVHAKMEVRDEKLNALKGAVQTLISELHVVLDPTAALWEEFGLKRPGILETPAVPLNLSAVLIGPTSVAMKWDKAARGRTYRIWKKVVGVDEEFIPVDSRTDLDYVIEGLPAGAQIEIAVSATNNGGESALSEPVVVATPAA